MNFIFLCSTRYVSLVRYRVEHLVFDKFIPTCGHVKLSSICLVCKQCSLMDRIYLISLFYLCSREESKKKNLFSSSLLSTFSISVPPWFSFCNFLFSASSLSFSLQKKRANVCTQKNILFAQGVLHKQDLEGRSIQRMYGSITFLFSENQC